MTRLLDQGRLYAATPQGLKAVTRFRPGLFFKVLAAAKTIRTTQGGKVRVGEPRA